METLYFSKAVLGGVSGFSTIVLVSEESRNVITQLEKSYEYYSSDLLFIVANTVTGV